MPASAPERAYLRVMPNRLIVEVETKLDPDLANAVPDHSVPRLSLNGYPDIWRGLQVKLERGSTLITSPIVDNDARHGWRAVAYLSPRIDDLIVGFVYGQMDEDGLLAINADSNRVRVGAQQLAQAEEVAIFGVRAWLVAFYTALALAIFVLLLFWRPGLRRAT